MKGARARVVPNSVYESDSQIILVVDDKIERLQRAIDQLKDEGYEVVTARSAEEAQREVGRRRIDIAVIDVRLVDGDSPLDVSGIDLAKCLNPSIPKIFLTEHRTGEAVRAALGLSLAGLPPAVGWVYKDEGFDTLLRTVRLGLSSESATFIRRLLDGLGAEAPVTLLNRITELGPVEAADDFAKQISEANCELKARRQETSAAIGRYEVLEITGFLVGSLLLVVTLLLVFGVFGNGDFGKLSFVGSLVANSWGFLELRGKDRLQKVLAEHDRGLERLSRAGAAIAIVGTLRSTEDRQEALKGILDWFLFEGPRSKK